MFQLSTYQLSLLRQSSLLRQLSLQRRRICQNESKQSRSLMIMTKQRIVDLICDSSRLIVFSISDQKSRLDSIFLTRLNHKLVVLSLVLHNFMKSISKSIS